MSNLPLGAEYDSAEIWKPVPLLGFGDKYEVSNLGKIKSIGTYNTCKKGVLIPMVDRYGYEHVSLYSNNIRKNISVHRLVATAFLPNPMNLGYVNHKDENTKNNRVSNLEWCTNAYNLSYSVGKKVKQYNTSGEYIKTFNSIAEASKSLNIPTGNISKCCKRLRKTAGKFIWKYE